MSHKAKFKKGDLIANAEGTTAVVRDAEPDDKGFIFVNRAENPDSEKVWYWANQNCWTKVRQYPERWLVFDSDGQVFADFGSLESARDITADIGADGILHVRKDGTAEWIDIEDAP